MGICVAEKSAGKVLDATVVAVGPGKTTEVVLLAVAFILTGDCLN